MTNFCLKWKGMLRIEVDIQNKILVIWIYKRIINRLFFFSKNIKFSIFKMDTMTIKLM